MKYYHYTSLDTFFNMLEKSIIMHDKCQVKYIEFWATSINAMNDTAERELYINEFIKRVKQFAESKNTPLTIEQESYLKNMGSDEIYIISFSGKKSYDRLDMWRGYGGNGTGICIGFDFDKVPVFYVSNEGKRLIMEDCYKFETCRYERAEDINIPDNLIQETYDAVTNPMSGCISDTIARAGILARITRESAIHKHVAYISEDEIRMIVPSNGEVFHNKIGSFIKPYVKYQIPISAITDITIGPCIKNSDHIKSIVRMIEKKLGPKVDIKYSSIPYRG